MRQKMHLVHRDSMQTYNFTFAGRIRKMSFNRNDLNLPSHVPAV